MTTEDILTLAKAGFTAAQIAALSGITQPAQPDPVQQMLSKLGVLTDTIQRSNLLSASQPAEQTPDDILAAIIRPPQKDQAGFHWQPMI